MTIALEIPRDGLERILLHRDGGLSPASPAATKEKRR